MDIENQSGVNPKKNHNPPGGSAQAIADQPDFNFVFENSHKFFISIC